MQWDEALDAFEARLALCSKSELLDAPPAWEPPPVSGPIPERLVPRAQALLTQAQQIQTDLEAQQVQVREELAALPRRQATAAGESRFVAHA